MKRNARNQEHDRNKSFEVKIEKQTWNRNIGCGN